MVIREGIDIMVGSLPGDFLLQLLETWDRAFQAYFFNRRFDFKRPSSDQNGFYRLQSRRNMCFGAFDR